MNALGIPDDWFWWVGLVTRRLGSTGTAKSPPYPYRVPRGYGYCRGTAACVPPVYPFLAKKKIPGTGRDKTEPKRVFGNCERLSFSFVTVPTRRMESTAREEHGTSPLSSSPISHFRRR